MPSEVKTTLLMSVRVWGREFDICLQIGTSCVPNMHLERHSALTAERKDQMRSSLYIRLQNIRWEPAGRPPALSEGVTRSCCLPNRMITLWQFSCLLSQLGPNGSVQLRDGNRKHLETPSRAFMLSL